MAQGIKSKEIFTVMYLQLTNLGLVQNKMFKEILSGYIVQTTNHTYLINKKG